VTRRARTSTGAGGRVVDRRPKTLILSAVLILLAVFLGWRFLRPMNIFDVSEAFERPIPTDQAPAMFTTQSAQECAACHREFVEEWKTSIHRQAWTDPYFQVDRRFDRKQQICKNCHTPLQRQQEHLVLGFRDQPPDRKLESALGATPRPGEPDRPGGGRTEGRNRVEPKTPATLPPTGWGCRAEQRGR
jgi:hypothetical protein